jgi:hypothetical protein
MYPSFKTAYLIRDTHRSVMALITAISGKVKLQ